MNRDNPIRTLAENGQSLWLDYIRRDLLEEGGLRKLIDEDGIAGMTSNPTIFDNAIGDSDMYDDDIREAGADLDPDEVFERIAVADIRRACDLFADTYEESQGRHGFVSIEVRPSLARDTDATIDEVRRLWKEVDRPNVMIKIPGTEEGLPAIRTCLSEGINVNITLLFAVPRYHQVIDAWFSAFEERLDAGEPIDRLASVASFFVSRVDSKVDGRLDALLEKVSSEQEKERIRSLKGRIGIDNARLAYHAFEERFRETARFARLADAGARVQRPLWASTSTKNPDYRDTLYVDELVAPDSVNTVPPETLEAFRDHGDPSISIYDELDGARRRMELLAEVGIDLAEVTRELEEEGVEKFADSYEALMKTIAKEQSEVAAA